MDSSDYLIRGVVNPLAMRFTLTETTATVTEAVRLHDTDPVSTIIFGQALTTAILTSPLLDGEERYTFRWEYYGKLRRVIADVSSTAKIRGLIGEPHLMTEAANENEIYGDEDGQLSIIRADHGKILHSGITRAGLLDVVDDAAFFFSTSDQIETEFECEIRLNPNPERPVERAVGIMLQALPGCDLKRFEGIRRELHGDRIRRLLTDIMPSEKKLWKVLEELTGNAYPKNNADLVYGFPVHPGYQCNCSQERLREAMLALGEGQLRKLFETSPNPGIKCEFCNRVYCFTREDFGL